MILYSIDFDISKCYDLFYEKICIVIRYALIERHAFM